MDRRTAQRIAFLYYKEQLDKKGNVPIMSSPQIGKNEWNTIEFINAAINDEPLENHSMNPVDSVLRMEKYMQEKGQNFMTWVAEKLPDYSKPVYIICQRMGLKGEKLWYEGCYNSMNEAEYLKETYDKYTFTKIVEI